MTPQRESSPIVSSVRRTVAVLAATAGLVALAGPAHADVPEGWPVPDDVDFLHVLLVLVGIPLGLFLLIALAVYLPALVRGERVAPGAARVENQWIGGPSKTTSELAGPDGSDSEAGGASARW